MFLLAWEKYFREQLSTFVKLYLLISRTMNYEVLHEFQFHKNPFHLFITEIQR